MAVRVVKTHAPRRVPARRRSGITAAVITHNSASHLAALAETLRAGSLRPDRLLVVDNASRDRTPEQARAAGFEVHETGANDGFGAACNAALRCVDTEFLLICNPDVAPEEHDMEQLRRALRENEAAAIAGAAFERPFLARRFSKLTANVWTFLPGGLQARLRRLSPEVPVDPAAPSPVDYVVGAFMLCRAGALRAVGGFDERFFLYCEEEDLCRRLWDAGWETLLVPSVRVGHRHSTSSAGMAPSSMAAYRFHSLYWYYRKYNTRPYAEAARAILACCVLLDRCYRELSGRPQVYGPAVALAPFRSIAGLRRLLAAQSHQADSR